MTRVISYPDNAIGYLQEAAIVGRGNSPEIPASSPDASMLAKSRDERQNEAYAHYATLKIYTAGQTLDLIDRWDIWPREDEDEWSDFVGRVYRRAAIDDAEHLTREAQSLNEAYNAQGLRHTPDAGMTASHASGGAS